MSVPVSQSACIQLPYRPLIDELDRAARLCPGDMAYLHSVGPDTTTSDVAEPARARYSMLAMRSYRRSTDIAVLDSIDPVTELGAIGYLGYDTHATQWRYFDNWLIEDHTRHTITAICLGHTRDAAAETARLRAWWTNRSDDGYDPDPQSLTTCDPAGTSDADARIVGMDQRRADYRRAVEHMQRHMRDGDVYVANMTMRLRAHSGLAPIDVFRRLHADNPSPYAAYLDFGDDLHGRVIVGSSPERFIRVWDGIATTEPIKGTRPRTGDDATDRRSVTELHASGKERAELLMITDLERNDMSRCCLPGSVSVPEYETIRAFPHVFHTVSVVTGRADPAIGIPRMLRLMSPGGSITGAPKRRAMEIIDECERTPRDIYTGSMGYIGLDPAVWLGGHAEDRRRGVATVCDLSIIIRAAWLVGRRKGYDYAVGAGGGVTIDSDPDDEYEEAVHKARAVLRAVGVPDHDIDDIDADGAEDIDDMPQDDERER